MGPDCPHPPARRGVHHAGLIFCDAAHEFFPSFPAQIMNLWVGIGTGRSVARAFKIIRYILRAYIGICHCREQISTLFTEAVMVNRSVLL